MNKLEGLRYVFSSVVWNQVTDHFFQVICLHLSGLAFHPLLEFVDLLVLSIRGLLNLISEYFSKTNIEQTKQTTLGSPDINMSFSQSLPLLAVGHIF